MDAALKDLMTKAAAGTLTDEERVALVKAMEADKPVATVTKTMKVSEFLTYAAEENGRLAKRPDAKRAAVLTKSIVAVKAAGKGADEEVTVEVVSEPSATDRIGEVIDQLGKLAEQMGTVIKAVTPDAAVETLRKAETIAVQLASEVLEAYSSKLLSLKGMLDAGTMPDKDEVNELFGDSWVVREAVDTAVASMTKREDAPDEDVLKAAADLLVKAVEPTDADGDSDADGDGAPDGDVSKWGGGDFGNHPLAQKLREQKK